MDHLLNADIVGLRKLRERAEASLATVPDQNRHVLVARQSAKYLEQPMGIELRLLYTDSNSLLGQMTEQTPGRGRKRRKYEDVEVKTE